MKGLIKNKVLIIFIFISIFVLLSGIYLYVIQGEQIDRNNISWIIDKERPIAHRGLHNKESGIPENSIKSFKNAIKYNYPIELDIQFTKDKQVIVFHDSNLKRLTGYDKDVNDVTYQSLQPLRLENTLETIPTLKEVLDLVNDQVPLVIEIKDCKDAKELAEEMYNIMKNYNGRYIVQSFNPFVLEHLSKIAPEVIRCQLSGDFKGEQNNHLKWYEKFVLKNMLLNFKSKPHIIGYDLNGIDNLSVKLLSEKYPIISWTIKDEEQMKRGYKKSDNIIFDNILP